MFDGTVNDTYKPALHSYSISDGNIIKKIKNQSKMTCNRCLGRNTYENSNIWITVIPQTHDLKFKAAHLPFSRLIGMPCLPAVHTAFKLQVHFSTLTEM